MGNELAVILGNLTSVVSGAIAPITYISYAVGLVFLGLGIMSLRSFGDGNGQGRRGKSIASIFIGVMLLSLTGTYDALSVTLFGHETQMLSSIPSGSGPLSSYITFAITLVVVVGYYCVVKGLIKIKATGEGREEQFWSGCTHIFGGIVCCNIVSFSKMVGSAAGGIVGDVVNKIFS